MPQPFALAGVLHKVGKRRVVSPATGPSPVALELKKEFTSLFPSTDRDVGCIAGIPVRGEQKSAEGEGLKNGEGGGERGGEA